MGALDRDGPGLAGYHANLSEYLCNTVSSSHNVKIVISSDFFLFRKFLLVFLNVFLKLNSLHIEPCKGQQKG